MTFDEYVLELHGIAEWLGNIEEAVDLDNLSENEAWLLTHETLRHVIRLRDCVRCGVNVADIGEWCSVKNEIWEKHGVADRVLCIGCLEWRMDRKLTNEDFIDAPVNDPSKELISERLLDRLSTAH